MDLGYGRMKFDKKWDRKRTGFKKENYSPRKNETAKFLTQPCNPLPQVIKSLSESTKLPAIYLVSV